MTTIDIDTLKRMLPRLVGGTTSRDVDSLADRINKFDHTGRSSTNPSMDTSLDPRDLREAARLIQSGGSCLSPREKTLFSAARLLAELFPTEASAYTPVDFRGCQRFDRSAKVAVGAVAEGLRDVASRLSDGRPELTLADCIRGQESLTWDERRGLSEILQQHFGIATWPDMPASGWESVLPTAGAPSVATSSLPNGVRLSLREEAYTETASVETKQCLRIESRPGDVVITPIGYGSNLGPYVVDQLLVCDENGVVEIPVRHLYPDRERITVLRPSAGTGQPPELLALAEVLSPPRKLEMTPPAGGELDLLSAEEVKEALRRRVEGPAAAVANRIIALASTPLLWQGASRPDLVFRSGRLPAGSEYVEVQLMGRPAVSAQVAADALPRTAAGLDACALTYYLTRHTAAGNAEIAGPFFIDE